MPKDVCGVVIAIACRSVLVQRAEAGVAWRTWRGSFAEPWPASQLVGKQRAGRGRTGGTFTGATGLLSSAGFVRGSKAHGSSARALSPVELVFFGSR